jgi:hypothetical protein
MRSRNRSKGLYTQGAELVRWLGQTSPVDRETGLIWYKKYFQTWNKFQKYLLYIIWFLDHNLALVDHVDKILKYFDNQGMLKEN